MAGRWQDDHQEQWRAQDDEPYFYGRDRERRSWDKDKPAGNYSAQRGGMGRDPVFGEGQSGANYGTGSGAQRPAPRFASQDYTGGGRYYGDDSRDRIYREEYGQGGREYGDVPRGYDAERGYGRQSQDRGGYGPPSYGGSPGQYGGQPRRPASGGTGGYDFERGYGDGGRGDIRGDRHDHSDRGDRFEDAGRQAGDFLHRAGERMASWFGGGERGRDEPREYREDFGRETRRMESPGARGIGPKGYKRPDERISDEVHERLTDDTWLDASNISVSVSGGEVTLSGTVENREAKHRAERIVEDLAGVNHVQNNLRVAKSGFLTSPQSGFGDSVLEAQMRQDDPVANGTGGTGGGQSTAGRKT
jgi:osmotically-inducible protein OsmY